MDRRTVLKTAALLAGGYLGVAGLARLSYRALLYPAPQRGLDRTPRGGELAHYPTDDGESVQVAIYRAGEGAPGVVYFHGNGESIADSLGLAQVMVEHGLTFVAVEYRGYGASPSRGPDEPGLYADAEGALRGLAGAGVLSGPPMLWGNSLGTGVAMEMAHRGHGRRLVLQAPFTSVVEVAARVVPLLPMRLIMGDVYDNAAKAPAITVPTLVIHGDRDRVVPYDMGQTLAATIPGATLLAVSGGGHNDLFVRERDRLIEAVVRHAKG